MNTDTTSQWQSRVASAFKTFQTTYLPKIKTAVSTSVEQLKQVDSKIEQGKYGDRYVSLKQEMQSAQESYVNTKTKIKSGYAEATAEGSAEPYPRAAKLGEALARTELSLRQQLKRLLIAAADRL